MDHDGAADDLRQVISDLRDLVRALRADLALERRERAAMRAENERKSARIEELEARLGRNSRNSSKPPSSDPPWSKRRKRRRPPSENQQGAQPGHPGATRELADEEDVDEVIDHEPDACTSCGSEELLQSGASPRRHQVTEIPAVVATITEHRQHARVCAQCGEAVVAALPAAVSRSAFGPRLHALVATLVADYRVSRSEVARFLRDGFGVRLSVGSVSNIEKRVSDALATAFGEALDALRASGLAHIDETPWKKKGVLHWVWTGVAEDAVVHRIDRRRNRDALERLIGVDYKGLCVTDRMASYDGIPLERRQLCWAHLERDFRAFVQGPAAGRDFGAAGLTIAQALMREARELKEHQNRERFEDGVRPHLGELIELLVDGACADIPKVSGFAAHLLARHDALWTFADQPGVPLTNNLAERAIRKMVLWRRGSFGSQSDRGLRFAERMATVIATKRRRAEGVLDYIVEVARAALNGTPAPKLIA